jgi:membrane peptidoglycan carboxypeptidase
VRPIDLAAFYAAIANEGMRPSPHVIERIERNGLVVYRHDPKSSVTIRSADRVAFYQLKTMLQGVLQRGTARSIAALSPYVAGKTGTSDEENDAWFVGFTNEVTVAVWVGYDNASGKRRTLGGGATGGHVAVPIFASIIQAVWTNVTPRTALAPPSAEARRQLSCHAIDPESGEPVGRRGRGSTECFRIDRTGRILDTQYQLVSREDAGHDSGGYYGVAPNPFPFFARPSRPQHSYPSQPPRGHPPQAPPDPYEAGRDHVYVYDSNGRIIAVPRDSLRVPWQYRQGGRDQGGQFQPRDPHNREGNSPQRIDPGYLWDNRRYY